MYRRPVYFLSIATMLMFSCRLSAQELYEHFVVPESLGMGGAYTAVANDQTSIWTNPAGIAKAKRFRVSDKMSLLTVPNLHLGVNSKIKSIYLSSAWQDESDLASIISEADDITMGTPYWSMSSLSPTVLFDISPELPAAFGLYSHSTMNMNLLSELSGDVLTKSVSDSGAFFAVTFANKQKMFNIGVQVRYVARNSNENIIEASHLNNVNEIEQTLLDNGNITSAVAVDVGAMYTLSSFWFPTFGISILNLPTGCKSNYMNTFSQTEQTVCGTSFTGDIQNETDTALLDPTDLRVGFSVTPRFTKNFATRVAVDIQDIHFRLGKYNYGVSDVPFEKKLHAGLEFLWGNPLNINPFSIKIGTHEDLVSAGMYLKRGSVSLDFTTYAKYVGSKDEEVPDRRYLLGISALL